MSISILITGGSRSGKSVYAETRTKGLCAKDANKAPIYIATAEALDQEMAARIATHQERRGPEWTVIAAPLLLAEALLECDGRGPCLVDCLTIWLSNLIFANRDIDAATNALLAALAGRQDEVIFVSNEVGSGIVPENALARRFRDEAGRLNQNIAAAVDEVYVVISGIPMRLKPQN